MYSVLLGFRNPRTRGSGIKLTQTFRCWKVLKEQYQRKAAAVQETQIPNKTPLTESRSTKRNMGETADFVIFRDCNFLWQQGEQRSNTLGKTKNYKVDRPGFKTLCPYLFTGCFGRLLSISEPQVSRQ